MHNSGVFYFISWYYILSLFITMVFYFSTWLILKIEMLDFLLSDAMHGSPHSFG